MFSDDEGSDPFDAGHDDAEDEPIPGTEAVLKQRLKAAIMFTIDQIYEHEVRRCIRHRGSPRLRRLSLDMHMPVLGARPDLANRRAIWLHDDMQASAMNRRFDKAYVAVLAELVMEVCER